MAASSVEVGFNTPTLILMTIARLKQADTKTLALYVGCGEENILKRTAALEREGYIVFGFRENRNAAGQKTGGSAKLYSLTSKGNAVLTKMHAQFVGSLKVRDYNNVTAVDTNSSVRLGYLS